MKKIITNSEKQTINLGKKIARQIRPGAVLGLVGELGAGKTQFVKGLAQGLGIKKHITSPTFVLIKNYPLPASRQGINNLIHIDCYRLSGWRALVDLGWHELIHNPHNIIVVEWADNIQEIMPQQTRWIKFIATQKENERKIILK